MIINNEKILSLIKQGENKSLEFKSEKVKPEIGFIINNRFYHDYK